jgi:hypothetical protein
LAATGPRDFHGFRQVWITETKDGQQVILFKDEKHFTGPPLFFAFATMNG